MGSITAYGQDTNSGYQIPKGVYIKLSKEFYDAIKNDHSTGTRVYTNDPSTEYLKQIAISTRFLAQTDQDYNNLLPQYVDKKDFSAALP